jgi:hypothetical protein
MDALSPMKTSPMKASPMKTSPIKDVLSENVSNQDRLVHKRRMHVQSSKPSKKRIRLAFSRKNLRKLATVPENEKVTYPPPPNINPFYHHDDGETKEEEYASTIQNNKSDSLLQIKPMWCKTHVETDTRMKTMSERQRLSRYHQDYQELGTIGS